MNQHPYHLATISFTTMHHKEHIISPEFNESFKATLVVPKGVDTDALGTFSGDINRDPDVKAVLRKKAEMGMVATDLDLGLASEGSFCGHPSAEMVDCNIETMLFVDKKKGIEIVANEISTYSRAYYGSFEKDKDIEAFLTSINFGKQGILVKPHSSYIESDGYIFKGIQTIQSLNDAISRIRKMFGTQSVWIETDNRAHFSPRRRETIRKACVKLIQYLHSLCPLCRSPGFSLVDTILGLKCELCGSKTNRAKSEIWRCTLSACGYEAIKSRSDGLKTSEPQYCNWCNP